MAPRPAQPAFELCLKMVLMVMLSLPAAAQTVPSSTLVLQCPGVEVTTDRTASAVIHRSTIGLDPSTSTPVGVSVSHALSFAWADLGPHSSLVFTAASLYVPLTAPGIWHFVVNGSHSCIAVASWLPVLVSDPHSTSSLYPGTPIVVSLSSDSLLLSLLSCTVRAWLNSVVTGELIFRESSADYSIALSISGWYNVTVQLVCALPVPLLDVSHVYDPGWDSSATLGALPSSVASAETFFFDVLEKTPAPVFSPAGKGTEEKLVDEEISVSMHTTLPNVTLFYTLIDDIYTQDEIPSSITWHVFNPSVGIPINSDATLLGYAQAYGYADSDVTRSLYVFIEAAERWQYVLPIILMSISFAIWVSYVIAVVISRSNRSETVDQLTVAVASMMEPVSIATDIAFIAKTLEMTGGGDVFQVLYSILLVCSGLFLAARSQWALGKYSEKRLLENDPFREPGDEVSRRATPNRLEYHFYPVVSLYALSCASHEELLEVDEDRTLWSGWLHIIEDVCGLVLLGFFGSKYPRRMSTLFVAKLFICIGNIAFGFQGVFLAILSVRQLPELCRKCSEALDNHDERTTSERSMQRNASERTIADEDPNASRPVTISSREPFAFGTYKPADRGNSSEPLPTAILVPNEEGCENVGYVSPVNDLCVPPEPENIGESHVVHSHPRPLPVKIGHLHALPQPPPNSEAAPRSPPSPSPNASQDNEGATQSKLLDEVLVVKELSLLRKLQSQQPDSGSQDHLLHRIRRIQELEQSPERNPHDVASVAFDEHSVLPRIEQPPEEAHGESAPGRRMPQPLPVGMLDPRRGGTGRPVNPLPHSKALPRPIGRLHPLPSPNLTERQSETSVSQHTSHEQGTSPVVAPPSDASPQQSPPTGMSGIPIDPLEGEKRSSESGDLPKVDPRPRHPSPSRPKPLPRMIGPPRQLPSPRLASAQAGSRSPSQPEGTQSLESGKPALPIPVNPSAGHPKALPRMGTRPCPLPSPSLTDPHTSSTSPNAQRADQSSDLHPPIHENPPEVPSRSPEASGLGNAPIVAPPPESTSSSETSPSTFDSPDSLSESQTQAASSDEQPHLEIAVQGPAGANAKPSILSVDGLSQPRSQVDSPNAPDAQTLREKSSSQPAVEASSVITTTPGRSPPSSLPVLEDFI